MPLLGFKKFLVPMVLYGDPWWKLGTIRALRKTPFEIWDLLFMHIGLRTSECEYLGVSLCTNEYSFTMHLDMVEPTISNWIRKDRFTMHLEDAITPNTSIMHWKQEKNPESGSKRVFWEKREKEELAIIDGFCNAEQMWKWFGETHGEESEIFQRIEWKIPPIKLKRTLNAEETKTILYMLSGKMKPVLGVENFMESMKHLLQQRGGEV
ncbi:MAG: hypothetical protein AYK18_17215 [Theionarchaea archaeon DG-70]|nr:MAG: hypothetical protein AYK18_17215 [Theionarchaea archaeon DG-70]